MNASEFINLVKTNEQLLREDCNCPLRVALLFNPDREFFYSDHWGVTRLTTSLSAISDSKGRTWNPDPDDAAQLLDLDKIFCKGVANGWDSEVFYGDSDNTAFELSGFLAAITFRPAPKLLPEAT